MKKHIIITKLFEFGGSNSHLSLLIRYFGKETILLILEDPEQLKYLNNIEGTNGIAYKIMPRLHKYAHLVYPSKLSNLRELTLVIKSIISIFLLSVKNGYADVTICAVEPEKHLYLLWLPRLRVTYILHTTPVPKFTSFTSTTCNKRLGGKKKIITVSKATKEIIGKNWDVSIANQVNICVVYNCVEHPQDVGVKKDREQQSILTMGHVIGHKNPMVWLEVARAVTTKRENVAFTWLGNGPLIDQLKEGAKAFERIAVPGFCSDTVDYLQRATIYYQPSLSETQGIAVSEAMSYSLPCVVSDAGGLPESVSTGYNGTVLHPTSVDAHVNALINLIDNNELRIQYGANSYLRYQELFIYDQFKINMDAIYITNPTLFN